MKNLDNYSLPDRSDLPKYTGKYFAIWNGEPVILTVGETGSTITYSDGETDPFYHEDNHGIESWVTVKQAFSSKLEQERDEARREARCVRAFYEGQFIPLSDGGMFVWGWRFSWEKGGE